MAPAAGSAKASAENHARSELLRVVLLYRTTFASQKIWFSRHAPITKENTLGEEGAFFWLPIRVSNPLTEVDETKET